jgi:hypothetical protein
VKTAIVLLAGLAACDPIWSAHTTLRDPDNRPIDNATVAVACTDGSIYAGGNGGGMSVRSDHVGNAVVGGLGTQFPVGCDLYIAKPGFRTQRIRYTDICPGGPHDCDRVFSWDLVLEPE